MNLKQRILAALAAGTIAIAGCGGKGPEKDILEGKVFEQAETFQVEFHTQQNYANAIGICNKYETEYESHFGRKKNPEGPQKPAERFHHLHKMNEDGKFGVEENELESYLRAHEWLRNATPANVTGTEYVYNKPTYMFDNDKDMKDYYDTVSKTAIMFQEPDNKFWRAYISEIVAEQQWPYEREGQRYSAKATVIEHPEKGKIIHITRSVIDAFAAEVAKWEE